ncbi:hypothetical protein [Variovorax sp. PMC12]|uniref:hypothetical protein n=1 Tax=Variovorax sp. PMC12 TaxID=2126319 RepID=UPI000D120ABD|nr:hypothetical protein [Variovorax sp. PMC12]AVQ81694.1 hypothetical protein C4F17_12445 [Variovorax sp. PMC12]
MDLLDTSPAAHSQAARDPSRYTDVFVELERAKLELLKVSDTIAAARRDFFENGVSTSAEIRSARSAEQRRLEILVQTLKIEALELRAKARELKGQSFLEALIKQAEAIGRSDLVEAAKAESLQALDASGLRLAYSMKGPA